MLRILIAPNSFKECADSVTISGYIESDLRRLLREKYKTSFTPIVRPISDGGDGFLEVCREIFNLKILQYKISSPWDETPVNCQVGYSKDRGIIFIESANVLGMKIIPKERRNPLLLSSKGMGELLLQLKEDKAKGELSFGKVVVGIGGTGISDFGIGMCSVLGLKLFSSSSEELVPIAQNFSETSKIVWQKPELPYEIEVILDVDNPLLGDNGACRVFSRQKGATDAQVELLESGISKLVNLLREEFPDNNNKPLYGAGGGLAAAFSYLLDAESKFARDFIRKDLSINKNLKADLVITGEGTF
ncbi:MAG: glycerate kinase, partial [Bacillota bacterium]